MKDSVACCKSSESSGRRNIILSITLSPSLSLSLPLTLALTLTSTLSLAITCRLESSIVYTEFGVYEFKHGVPT